MIAVVERADRDVVAEFGVPLRRNYQRIAAVEASRGFVTHGISDGVSGFDGGSSSIDVGAVARDILSARDAEDEKFAE